MCVTTGVAPISASCVRVRMVKVSKPSAHVQRTTTWIVMDGHVFLTVQGEFSFHFFFFFCLWPLFLAGSTLASLILCQVPRDD